VVIVTVLLVVILCLLLSPVALAHDGHLVPSSGLPTLTAEEFQTLLDGTILLFVTAFTVRAIRFVLGKY